MSYTESVDNHMSSCVYIKKEQGVKNSSQLMCAQY